MLLLLLACSLLTPTLAQPRHLYLTWNNPDTAHSQTIVFQTISRAINPRIDIYLKGSKLSSFKVKTVMIPGHPRRIHYLTIKGLKARSLYRFRAGDERYGMSKWRSFKTLPADDSPVRAVTGGDMYRHLETVQLLAAGSQKKPDVGLIGGDISYADGRLTHIGFWDDWLDNWNENMNYANGRIVPMILAIGNHEVSGAFGQDRSKAPFYFGLFPQGGEPYFLRKLGSEIELMVLDSGHVTHHRAQQEFIKKSLSQSRARYKVALYHVPCYPTHRSPNDPYSSRGRHYWVPLFDKYGLDVAFENHDHVFKRTHPLKNNKIDKTGTVYLGEGCWGRTPREAYKRWYHVKSSAKRHVWLFENTSKGLRCQAIDRFGKVFDRAFIGHRRD